MSTEKIGHTRDECTADDRNLCTRCGLPVPQAGFIVIRRGEDGRLSDDWDGEVHETRDDGEIAVAEAIAAGYDAFLSAAIPLTPIERGEQVSR